MADGRFRVIGQLLIPFTAVTHLQHAVEHSLILVELMLIMQYLVHGYNLSLQLLVNKLPLHLIHWYQGVGGMAFMAMVILLLRLKFLVQNPAGNVPGGCSIDL
jgi:hypothetical protein